MKILPMKTRTVLAHDKKQSIRQEKNMKDRGMNAWRYGALCILLATGTIAQAANDFIVAPSGGDLTGAELSAQLARSDVTLRSSSGRTSGKGNVIIRDVVTWNSNTTLTLVGSNTVRINAGITATGNAAGITINPNTANGNEPASGDGNYDLASSITLSGTQPRLLIGGTTYTVINSLGAASDAANPPVTATLQSMAARVNLKGKYALGSNIDASSTATWNGGAGFTPIGDWANAQFTGTLDGLGHTINKLSIKQAPIGGYQVGSQIGLFGFADVGSTIRNVGLTNCDILSNTTGNNIVAGLVAMNYGGILNSYVTGSVKGNRRAPGNSTLGGLVAMNSGSISNSYFSGSVYDNSIRNIGGLVGSNSGSISSSYASASVSADTSAYLGVLVGQNFNTISNSYATGSIGGSAYYQGGLAGYNCQNTERATGCTKTANITNSYASVSTSNGAANGLLGRNEGSISNSYWNTTLAPNGIGSNIGTISNTNGLSATQMRIAANFSGFDFAAPVWVIVKHDGTVNGNSAADGATFPMLASEQSSAISSAHQLQLMAMQPDLAYTLNASFDAAGTSGSGDIWGSAGFIPVGSYSVPFSGSLDGQGNTISNLSITDKSSNRVGLFGVVARNSIIKNVTLSGGTVSGYDGGSIGSLIGINNGNVSNASSSAAVSGMSGGFVGGLIGSNNGSINKSKASGNVGGSGGFRGGLVGSNGGVLNDSTATGKVGGQGGSTGPVVGYTVK